MLNTNKKTYDKEKARINPVVAGAAGAVVGAGVAIAAYQTLKEEKNRDNLRKGLSKVKDEALEYVNDINPKASKMEGSKKIKKNNKAKIN